MGTDKLKLAELKTSLIEQFFTESSSGLDVSKLPEVYKQLRAIVNDSDSQLLESSVSQTHSNEPSKAFTRFTKDRDSLITIIEEDGLQKRALFVATKHGTQISYVVLTQENQEPVMGSMKIIKDALRQAKHLNDEVDFLITTL